MCGDFTERSGDWTQGMEGINETSKFNVEGNGTIGSRRVEHCLFEGEFFLLDSRREEVEISVVDGGGVTTGIGGGEECFSKRARSVGATTSGVIASVAGGRSCRRGKNWCDWSAI